VLVVGDRKRGQKSTAQRKRKNRQLEKVRSMLMALLRAPAPAVRTGVCCVLLVCMHCSLLECCLAELDATYSPTPLLPPRACPERLCDALP
jgi:hypothetical protein